MNPYTERVEVVDRVTGALSLNLWMPETIDEQVRPYVIQSAIDFAPKLLHEHQMRFAELTPTETRRVSSIPSTYGTWRLFKVVLLP